MKTRTVAAIAVLIMVVAPTGCSPDTDSVMPSTGQDPLVVFLVRHGEKAGPGEDPELSAAGLERAGALADTLRNAEIRYVHSSDFIRTRDTAAPYTVEQEQELQLYDPQDLPALVEKLNKTGGRHLVVGHSDTTPALARLLGGEGGSPIEEESEFDRLYIIAVGKDGSASSILMRYGDACRSGNIE